MNANNIKKFKNNIKKYRQFKELTQEELAEKCGVRPDYLSKVETGKMYGSLPLHLKISEVLNVSLDDLLKVN